MAVTQEDASEALGVLIIIYFIGLIIASFGMGKLYSAGVGWSILGFGMVVFGLVGTAYLLLAPEKE